MISGPSAEFAGPVMRCLDAQLVIFSGLKADKLDDLEAMIDRGKITRVFAAGALSGALRKAHIRLGQHDTVAPDLAAPVRDGSKVIVRYGRLIDLTLDGRRRQVWVTALSVAPTDAAALRDGWHRRLDVPVVSVAHWQVVAMTACQATAEP